MQTLIAFKRLWKTVFIVDDNIPMCNFRVLVNVRVTEATLFLVFKELEPITLHFLVWVFDPFYFNKKLEQILTVSMS